MCTSPLRLQEATVIALRTFETSIPRIISVDRYLVRSPQLWDERIGSAHAQAKNWRSVAFGSLALAGGLSTRLLWQSTQSRVTPYVVEFDKSGEVRAVTPAIQNDQRADLGVGAPIEASGRIHRVHDPRPHVAPSKWWARRFP